MSTRNDIRSERRATAMDSDADSVRQRVSKDTKSNSSNCKDSNFNSDPKHGADFQQHLQENTDQTSGVSYRSASEYAQALQQWIWQYHMHNQMQAFCMNLSFNYMSCMSREHNAGNVAPTRQYSAANPQQDINQSVPRATPEVPQSNTGAQSQRRDEFNIPRLWKRVVAEIIDFFILFIVKLAVTIMTVEYVGIIDLERYDLEQLMKQDLDYNAAFAITSELVAMEIINRIFICIFETLCLRKGMVGLIGGTTPGKRIMGIKVVSCDSVTDLGGNKVRISPAGNLGTWNALVRSVIKNFSLAFFFPVCFTVFFFQHNRAAYDVISNCIVVEATEEDRQIYRLR